MESRHDRARPNSTKPLSLSVEEAIDQAEAWLVCPAAMVVDPAPRHLRVWADVMAGAHGGGDLVNDAHLAALALENRATVVSFDCDFQHFDGLRLLVPPPAPD